MAYKADLTTQDVEVIGRRGAVDDLKIGILDLTSKVTTSKPLRFFNDWHLIWIFVRHLQKAFHSGTAVFGSLTVVSMRQQQHQTALTIPFRLSSNEELINHDLKTQNQESSVQAL